MKLTPVRRKSREKEKGALHFNSSRLMSACLSLSFSLSLSPFPLILSHTHALSLSLTYTHSLFFLLFYINCWRCMMSSFNHFKQLNPLRKLLWHYTMIVLCLFPDCWNYSSLFPFNNFILHFHFHESDSNS